MNGTLRNNHDANVASYSGRGSITHWWTTACRRQLLSSRPRGHQWHAGTIMPAVPVGRVCHLVVVAGPAGGGHRIIVWITYVYMLEFRRGDAPAARSEVPPAQSELGVSRHCYRRTRHSWCRLLNRPPRSRRACCGALLMALAVEWTAAVEAAAACLLLAAAAAQ